MSEYYVYMLRCADSSLYTWITTQLEKRIKEHSGDLPGGAKYTSGRRPVTLVYHETAINRSEASKRELQIKKFSRKEKESLIEKNYILSTTLPSLVSRTT